ncbi:MAG TPA: alpha/beta hydrolase [Ramlibacter sp.]|nr:alpha/beta hydrolase [Ramlibacter sp.]
MVSPLERNNVHVQGSGPPMVFVHGFGCDQNMWRLVAPHFAENHQVILLDLVGSGKSHLASFDKAKYATLQGYADDLCEVLAAVTSAPAVCVGHSVSAMIGMLANLRNPDAFLAQIMVGPSPCYINDGDYVGGFERADIESLLETLDSNYLGWASNMAPAIMGAPDRPELAVELAHVFCRTDPDIARHFARVTFLSDHRKDLARLRSPTLVLQCSEDLIAPLAVGEYLRKSIPDCTLRIVDNIGHCPHLSAPGATIAAMEEFLRTL